MLADEHGEHARLTHLYARMPNEELLRISAELDELTPEARQALVSELRTRGLKPLSNGAEIVEHQQLVTIRQFRDPGDAMVARTILESAGIEALLADDNMVRMDWFYSNLIGGVKLKVNTSDVEAAEEILNQPVPEEFDVEGAGNFVQPRCPRCNSLEIVFTGLNKPASYTAMFLNVPIPIRDSTWTCEECGHRWEETSEAQN